MRSYGWAWSHGPTMAASASTTSTTALATAARLRLRRIHASWPSERPAAGASERTGSRSVVSSVIAHARIKPCIKNVDDQIEKNHEARDHHDGAHHQRVVAAQR